MGKSGMVLLKKDVLYEEEGFKSVVLWRLKIVDQTGDFKKCYPTFIALDQRDLFNRLMNKEDNWTEKDGAAYYDGTFMTQSRPGTCTIESIRLPLGTSISGGVYTKGTKTSTYFDIDVDKSWVIPPGKVLYLGEFVVNILKREIIQGRGSVYTYNVTTSRNREGVDSSARIFRERYPDISGHFKNDAESAVSLLLNESFSMLSYRRGWAKRVNDEKYDAYISTAGEYVINTKTNTSAIVGIRPLFILPDRCDIELVSTWKSGMDNRPYGLLIGTDLKDFYRFAVSADGHAKASRYINGTIQSNSVSLKDGGAVRSDGIRKNLHKVEVRGDTLRYYVNGNLVGEIDSRLKRNQWFVGVTVSDRQEVTFDDLKITER